MNYTENYHLPQWVKTDRIMMDDFNQMCADLEAGMTENAQTAADVRQNSDQLDQKTLERLRRLAYNHYTAVQDMDPFPWQVGVFHQNPVKDGIGGKAAPLLNNKVCFAGKIPEGTTLGSSIDYMQEVSQMTLVKNDLASCTPLQVNVYVPVNAYVNTIALWGSVNDNVLNTPAPVRLTLTNLDTGEMEADYLLDITQQFENAASANNFCRCFLIFHAKQHYRLQIEPLEAVFSGIKHLYTSDVEAPLIPAHSSISLIASHTMREHQESSGGLLIVRGLVHNGTLKVSWDGQLVPLHTYRMVRLPDGPMVREMVYYRNETIPAETEFSLQFDAGERGSFVFYDWGAVLL